MEGKTKNKLVLRKLKRFILRLAKRDLALNHFLPKTFRFIERVIATGLNRYVVVACGPRFCARPASYFNNC